MWITVDVERALYVDRGRNVILCELLPGHQTLVLKLKGSEMKTPDEPTVIRKRDTEEASGAFTDQGAAQNSAAYRSALESIADWRNVNISGEYEHGLRDIIRSIIDCAVDALDAPQVPCPAPQGAKESERSAALEPFIKKMDWPLGGLPDTDVIQCRVVTPNFTTGGDQKASFGLTVADFRKLREAFQPGGTLKERTQWVADILEDASSPLTRPHREREGGT